MPPHLNGMPAYNSGGKAFPIIAAAAHLPSLRSKKYLRGNDCKSAASRRVIERLASGWRNRPLEGLKQPEVIVGEGPFHFIRPYTSLKPSHLT